MEGDADAVRWIAGQQELSSPPVSALPPAPPPSPEGAAATTTLPGLSHVEAIASLPETTTVAEMLMETECAVCFESYETGDRIRTMPCSHGFHEGCILKWLGVSRLCPLCRFALQAADEAWTN